jgi:hypothetical protein
MVMVTPRAAESLVARLSDDTILQQGAPGGVWRPVLPQGQDLDYPAVAFALSSGQIARGSRDAVTRLPTKQYTELFFEVTAWTPGTDDIPIKEVCDRIESLLDGFEDDIDGVHLSWMVMEEIQRTPQELNFFHTQQGWLVRCRGV